MVRLEVDDFHYLVRVRRLAPGEFFPALLPNGAEALIQVRSVEGGVLTGECKAANTTARPDAALPPIILFQALPKGENSEERSFPARRVFITVMETCRCSHI